MFRSSCVALTSCFLVFSFSLVARGQLGGGGFGGGGAVRAGGPQPGVIHVEGSSLVSVEPDQVDIALTITTVDDDLIRVRESGDKIAAAIVAACKKQGVDAKAFAVSRLELSLDFNQQLKRQIYKVERDVTISLLELNRLDAVLSDLLKESSIKVSGISYATTKAREFEKKALQNAVTNAQEQARLLAELHGLKLGKAVNINVVDQSFRPFVTSVVPVVGAADPAQRLELERSERLERAIGAAERNGTQRRFVALQQPAAGGNQPFGLGVLEFSARVWIDYQLAE